VLLANLLEEDFDGEPDRLEATSLNLNHDVVDIALETGLRRSEGDSVSLPSKNFHFCLPATKPDPVSTL